MLLSRLSLLHPLWSIGKQSRGNKYSGPAKKGVGVDCNQEKTEEQEEIPRLAGWGWGRLKVILILNLKVEWGHRCFIAMALLLLFAQPGVSYCGGGVGVFRWV